MRKSKTKTKTKTRKHHRIYGGDGLFNYVNESDANVIYLNPGKWGEDRAWGAVYLPHLPAPNSPPITAEFIRKRIDVLYDFLTRDSTFINVTKCLFNQTIKDRINKIKTNSDKYNQSPNFDKLCNEFIEIQLYVLICRSQTANRGAGINLFGSILGTAFGNK